MDPEIFFNEITPFFSQATLAAMKADLDAAIAERQEKGAGNGRFTRILIEARRDVQGEIE